MPGLGGDSFIQHERRRLPPAAGALPYCLGRFWPERFTADTFDRYGLVPPGAVRASVRQRQAEFLAGRLCARDMLAAHGQAGATVGIGAHREPLWPAGLCGSISHNQAYAAALVVPSHAVQGIGIDIESLISEYDPGFAGIVLSPDEQERLGAQPGGWQYAASLTAVFSAKESFFKAAFPEVQAYFDFDALELVELDLAAGLCRFRCSATLAPNLPAGREVWAHVEFIDSQNLLSAVCLAHLSAAGADAGPVKSSSTEAASIPV